jgi:hypothetical protein
MKTWLDYLVAIIIIAIGSLFGPIGFIIAVVIVARLASSITKSTSTSRPLVTPAEQSIEDAWRATDMTTVPADMLLAYRRYLKSEPWYVLRRIVLKRDGHRCTRCGYIGNLQVHHTDYRGIYENFNFSIDQLESVCYECHRDVHKGILPMKKE